MMKVGKPQKNRQKNKGFAKNTAIILIGHLVATGISLLTLPIITRLFSPNAFGVLAIFTSMTMSFAPLASLSYEGAMLLPKSRVASAYIKMLSIVILALISILVGIGVLISGDWLADLLGLDSVQYLYVFPIGLILIGLSQIFTFWAIRENLFIVQAKGRVVQALTDRIVGVTSGIYVVAPGPWWLILSQLIGQLCLVLIIWPSRILSHSQISKNHKMYLLRICAMAKRYKKFPIYSASANFMQAMTRELPIIILALFFSPIIVGFYALARRVIGQPFMMLGDSISRSFFHKAAEAKRESKELVTLTERLLYYLLAGTLYPLLVLILLINDLFSIVFGVNWEGAGSYAQLVGVFFFIAFIFRPISVFFDLMEMQEKRLFFNSVLLVTNVLILVTGGIMGDPLMTVGAFVFSNFLLYSFVIIWLCRCIGVTSYSILKLLLRVGSSVFPIYLLTVFFMHYLEMSVMVLTLSAALSCFVYYIVLILRDKYLTRLLMVHVIKREIS